jgi:hypothetical protein
MIGAGPAWSWSNGEGSKFAGTIAADFTYRPTGEKKFGWFVGPAYSDAFAKGHERSIGVTVGS